MAKILRILKIAREEDSAKVHVNVEGLRTLIYFLFYVIVATGVFLTLLFSELDFEDNIVLTYFGTNNICVFFDYPPASYVLPFLWAITCFVMVVERFCALVGVWLSHVAKHISRAEYAIVTLAIFYQILSFWFFSTIFAVQPHDLHTLRIHTVPYTNLVLSLAVMAMTNIWYAWKVGYGNFGFPPKAKWLLVPYITVLVLVSAHQVIHHVHSMAYEEPWNDAPFPLNLSLGNVWLVLVVVLPPAWNLYLNCALSDKAVQIALAMSLSVGPGVQPVPESV